MKVAIIGAGFGGLACAYELAKNGVEVVVFEAEDKPGGLALGFKEKNWNWTLEYHYHHWFMSDNAALNLAQDIGHRVFFIRPKTSTYYNGKIYQIDSPFTLMRFNQLPLLDRVKTAFMLSYLKLSPFWRNLEGRTAYDFIVQTAGINSWNVLWGPLFIGKFGNYAKLISATWFWARIHKRSASLGYPEGGFLNFAYNLQKHMTQKYEVSINYKSKVIQIKKRERGLILETSDGSSYVFDKVVCTLPNAYFVKIVEGLPSSYVKKFTKSKSLGAINLVLRLNKSFLEDNTYWLNINDLSMPFLAIVQHTNFMDKKNYGNEHIVYIGNYLPDDHVYFNKSAEELIAEFLPHLKKINQGFSKSWIKKAYVFKAKFAQPIVSVNYSKFIPSFETPIAGVYLCNMQQVYPYDRGTNYAIELGIKVARL
ncbi:MAG: FAD-dependent oxidoreductase, partial [Patescibacteria group bacterium]|nr:FAD-dependent oxidoreductase [Patescibacteria group bacterium]